MANLFVGSRRPILEIVDYYCGCPPQSALILNLIEGFEMACNINVEYEDFHGHLFDDVIPGKSFILL